MLKEALERNDRETYKKILRLRMDNSRRFIPNNQPLKGWSKSKDKYHRFLRRLTHSKEVPAEYQTSKGNSEAVWSTIINITDKSAELSKVEKAALEEARGWLDKYKTFNERFESEIDALFDSKATRDQLLEDINSGKLSYQIFEEGDEIVIQTAEGPIRVKNMDEVKSVIAEKRRIQNTIRSKNWVYEWFRNSMHYKMMEEQGYLRRYLELVDEKIRMSGNNSNFAPEQIKLFEEIRVALMDPSMRPPSDVMALVQKREIRAERRAVFRFWKSKRVAKDMKWPVSDEAKQLAEKLSPFGLFTRFSLITGTVTVLTGGIAIITLPLEEQPQYKYALAYINNYWNDFTLWATDKIGLQPLTPTMLKCADSERSWNLEEESRSDKLFKSHLSRFHRKTEFDPSYDYKKDPKYWARVRELNNICIKLRQKRRNAEAHFEHKKWLNDVGYRYALDSMLIDALVAERVDKRDKLSDEDANIIMLVEKLLDEHVENQKNEKVDILLRTITKLEKNLGDELSKYLEHANIAAKRLDDAGAIDKYKDVVDFFKVVEAHHLDSLKENK